MTLPVGVGAVRDAAVAASANSVLLLDVRERDE